MVLYVVAALVFLMVAGVAYAVLDQVISDDRRVSRRLKGLTDYEVAQAHEAQPMLAPFTKRVLLPFATGISAALKAAWPAEYRSRITRKLERAGHPRGMNTGRFTASKVLCCLGALGVTAVFAMFSSLSFGTSVFLAVVFGVLAFFAPDLWLSSELSSRQHRIVRELPDMLDMLTISVEAGMGFDAALAKIVRSTRGPLSEEFGRALQELQAGTTRREALRHMAERVDVAELSAFTASLIQADIFGISVAQVLRSQSAEMRLRRRQRAEEQAAKVPVKMVIPLTLCILPATLIVVAGPAAIGISKAFGN